MIHKKSLLLFCAIVFPLLGSDDVEYDPAVQQAEKIQHEHNHNQSEKLTKRDAIIIPAQDAQTEDIVLIAAASTLILLSIGVMAYGIVMNNSSLYAYFYLQADDQVEAGSDTTYLSELGLKRLQAEYDFRKLLIENISSQDIGDLGLPRACQDAAKKYSELGGSAKIDRIVRVFKACKKQEKLEGSL